MDLTQAAGGERRQLFVFNAGFLTGQRIRRILDLAGWQVRLGKPGPQDWVGVWGRSPTAPRGEAVAGMTGNPVLRVEDAFLRSVLPGRDGTPPIGLCLDRRGVHFDSSAPSDLEHLLATHPLDDTALLERARSVAERIRRRHLSKYNAFDTDAPVPQAPYVLVIDQTLGDASIEHGGATAATFKEMLVFAQTENPGSRIIIKTHPDTAMGHRPGHFGPEDAGDRISLLSDPVSPWALLEGATAVYTVSSLMGFEAIMAGHRPRVFGQPFYAGWGLTQDETPVARRSRKLTRSQLYAGAMLLYPVWYDPARDRLCDIEEAMLQLEAEARHWRLARHGFVAVGMRPWKRPFLQGFFGRQRRLAFARSTAVAAARAAREGRKVMTWGATGSGETAGVVRVEDGFLRSRGLGATLVPPLSLVADDLGIYYDPSRPSRLEVLIAASGALPEAEIARARRLIDRLGANRLSKYNLGGTDLPELPAGHRILVPGQVEDDASIRLGCDAVTTNLELLRRTRAANPAAIIVYKPHPDVEAGLRAGALSPGAAQGLADVVADKCDPVDLIEACDEVWTMTSLMGFEALLRGRPVSCLGTPFYAGWGLTRDFGPALMRRIARPSLEGLVHAALIDYPLYLDPVSGLPCPVEVIVERLAGNQVPPPRRLDRLRARVQGLLMPLAPFWR